VTTVALGVSGHGFGHAVRSAEVASALLARGVRVLVRSDAPPWLFPDDVEWLPNPGWPLDVGVAQHDGLELDIVETRRRWEQFASEIGPRADVEARSLVEHGVDLVIGDIPPLAFAAAARAHIPSLALGNFTWDWIYAAWPGFNAINARIRAAYAEADVLLRLPLHATTQDAFCAFERVEDVPLIARRARRTRFEVRRELGLKQDARVVLVSFGGFGARGFSLTGLGRWTRYVFIVTPPLTEGARRPAENVLALNETPPDYVSLLGACDAVITKPGYGIVADCLANRVAVLFTERGPFREYDVLAEALPRLGRACHIPREALIRGDCGPYLDRLFERGAAWTDEPTDGADVVADRTLSNLTVKQQSR
jgi:hypothetical protein